MHYNIALLSKKVTNYVTLITLNTLFSRYFLNMSRAWLFVFNIRSSIANVKAFHTKKCKK